MAHETLFPPDYRPGSSEQLALALEVAGNLNAEAMRGLEQQIGDLCADADEAAEFARKHGLSRREIAALLELAIRLHIRSAATATPLGDAPNELEMLGASSAEVEALRQLVPYLAQADAEMAAHMGRAEALNDGLPKLRSFSVVWNLRAAFGEALYVEGNAGDEADELRGLIPVGMLSLHLSGTENKDITATLSPEDLDWMIRELQHARRRLDAVGPYSLSGDKGEPTDD